MLMLTHLDPIQCDNCANGVLVKACHTPTKGTRPALAPYIDAAKARKRALYVWLDPTTNQLTSSIHASMVPIDATMWIARPDGKVRPYAAWHR